MHELSIAQNIIEIVKENLRDQPSSTVRSVRIRIGALSCVHRDALQFSFEFLAADTELHGALLIFDEAPVIVYCLKCDGLRQLSGIQLFECPECGTLTGDIRQGRELDVESIEIIADPHSCHAPPDCRLADASN